MTTLYTRAMFQKFEQELIQSTTCFLELKTEDASKVVFNMSERKNLETRVAKVVYDKYSDQAWKKTVKSGLVSDANGNEIKDCADPGLLIKLSTMPRLASDVKLKLLKDVVCYNEVGGSSSQTQYMKNPKRVRCKGSSKLMGPKEKAMKRGI
ncbi:unnamed protein product [Prunus armeniaca]